MKEKLPNIIFVCADQMRSDALHHLGNPASHTPVMDLMAEEGVSFDKAFCQNPVCVPSRCSFMTGLYPHVRGHRTMGHMLQKDEPCLTRHLKDNGYHVWMNRRNDLLPAQLKNYHVDYCDEYFKPEKVDFAKSKRGECGTDNYYSFYRGEIEAGEDYTDSDQADINGLIELIGRMPEDKPYFAFAGLFYPHPPYAAQKKHLDLIDKEKLHPRVESPRDISTKSSMLHSLREKQNMTSWSKERWDDLRKTYLAMCAQVDEQLGMVVKALKDKGVYDNTIIIFTSDHGDYTGDYEVVEKSQNTFEDCLTNVPLIIKPTKDMDVRPGINPALVELIDIYATIEDVTGVEATHNHFGKSLIDLIAGRSKAVRDAVFCEGGRLKHEIQAIEYTNPKKRTLDENFEYYPRQSTQASNGPEHTKATMCRTENFKYVKRYYENDEFYDLTKDPKEVVNEIDNPEYQDKIKELKLRMLDWYQETCDTVPLNRDSRFSDEDLIEKIKSKLPENVFKMMVEPKLKSGTSVFELLDTLM